MFFLKIFLSFIFCLLPMHLSAGENIKIAAVFSRTGIAADYNTGHFHGVRFAIHEINKGGGLLGKRVELLEFDNMSTKIGSKVAADKAIQEGVIAVIGASWSSHSLGMAPVLQKAGIPMITPDSTNAEVTRTGDYIFRVCFIDPFQAKVMSQFAIKELKAKRVAILKDVRSDYSMGLSQVFRKGITEMGGSVILDLSYMQKQVDFSSQLSLIKKMQLDAVYIAGHDESGFIVKQARNIGVESFLLGGDGWDTAAFLLNGGNELSKGYYTTHWSALAESEISLNFTKKFGEFYSKVESFAALSYDATMLLANAIDRAGTTNRIKIREALARTENYPGVTGSITFDKHGDPIKEVVIMKLEKGEPHYVESLFP